MSPAPLATLEVAELSVRRGGKPVIAAVSFERSVGLHLVHGPNGAGKSTLLRALAGVLPLASGRVRICGRDLASQPEEAKLHLGWLPEGADLFPDLPAADLVGTVAALRGAKPQEVATLVDGLGLRAAIDHRMRHLSYGQRRKVALAAALVGEPPLLLLDEPDDGLDEASLTFVHEHLQRQSERAVVLVATHREAPGEATSVIHLDAPTAQTVI